MAPHRARRAAAAVCVLLLALPVAATARVRSAETVLPPGQSGHVPQDGQPANPHLTDQVALFEAFAFKPAGFDQPGRVEAPRAGVTITRDGYGVPAVRGLTARDAWWGVGYAVAEKPRLEFYDRGTWSQAVELGP